MAASQGSLDALVTVFMQASTADATKSTYRSHLKCYLQFCHRTGYVAVPASSITICRYIAHLSQTLKYSSIRQYIGIIRMLHLYQGLPNPLAEDVRISAVLKGVRRLKGDVVCRKVPMTVDVLLNIRATLNMHNMQDCTFLAACLIAFFGMLRKSSLFPPKGRQPLRVGCVQAFNWGLSVRFLYSKTVQNSERQTFVALPVNKNMLLCPCLALLQAWKSAGARSRTHPMLPITGGGGLVAMDQHSFTAKLAQVMGVLGLQGYSGHSFRRGGATHALKSGVPAEVIKAQGDWKSLAYLDYLDMDNVKDRANVIGRMYT